MPADVPHPFPVPLYREVDDQDVGVAPAVRLHVGDAIFDAGNQSRCLAKNSWASRPTKNGGAA